MDFFMLYQVDSLMGANITCTTVYQLRMNGTLLFLMYNYKNGETHYSTYGRGLPIPLRPSNKGWSLSGRVSFLRH